MITVLTKTMAATGAQQRHNEKTAMNTKIYKSLVVKLTVKISLTQLSINQ